MGRIPANRLFKHLGKKPPRVLYHYTSLDALEAITDSGKLWATEIHYLNDRTEYVNACEFVRSMLESMIARDRAAQIVVRPHLDKYLQSDQKEEIFVASFSEDGDSLPQWRGYCQNGRGVAIGFLSFAMEDILPDDEENPADWESGDAIWSLGLHRCVYTRDEKRRLVLESVNDYLAAIRGENKKIGPDRAGPLLSSLIGLCGPLFKDESFKEEKEWRLVLESYFPDVPKRSFRVGKSTLIPFVTMNVRENHPSTYISEVVVGPAPEEKLAIRGTGQLLRSRKLEGVKIRASKVPYRTW